MSKEEIIEEFFRSLKVALTNAFSYTKDHPYFTKSVENFKLKLETLLVISNPFKIGVTSSGLVVDGKDLNRAGFYDELARLLHQRKIKSIEIKGGASLQEIVQFLGIISLPPKEIFKSGGLSALLEKEPLAHFTIQELDYSAFLHGEGQECTDIWGYMLKEAVHSNNAVKIDQLADSFGSLIKRVNEKDFLDAEGVSTEVNEFLICLRNKNKDKFDKCLNDVFLWLLRNKKTLNQDNLAKLKPAFNGLNQEEFTSLLQEGFLQEDNFDSLSLQLFSKISEQKDSPQIAKNFFSKMNEKQGLKDDPAVANKIRNLLSSSQDDPMSAVYRNTLDALVKNISFSGKLSFDHRMLVENYRYIVLGILATDEKVDILQMAAAILEKELAGVFEDNAAGFAKDLGEVLAKRKQAGIKACMDLEKSFSSAIENIALSGHLSPEQEFLLERISLPSRELNAYLDKIFTVEKVNKHILSLFFKFFPENLDIFYLKVEQRLQDIEFISSLITALGQLTAPVILSILDHIYSSANELIKVEILNAMRKLKKVDAEFLMRQLNTDSPSLRKNLLSVLILDPQAKNGALELLFGIPSFCGSKNELLIENMQIVFDLGFMEAAGHIRDFSRRKFFWNRELRAKANRILREWNVS
ncbi:MAG: hypothetical protein KKC39_03755 [Candidatus Omnitrophica bacterium]|nr:hypothetical protein [Candidatus Omnitrophota bacterium]MBU4303954.1 hypothetical protein [Candidatus Omnitrophota bacterium]MBU4418734.1 hypothetical protein [Candidatus Omnitrophota bacterium]MBU4467839.1 hypothetical protein [Candidatus Omnitrophota bacterium]MCG2707058.1 hypothetical protein [Candidatus Omnitrophota bacterium]